ncbi:hypothetical protein OUZ56_016368 [Daphnia magna]|uniref:Uncharacterized protein n=1 Tax=Daphnia magna TaxID=35525 RepID=A0ABR0AQV6_9CRUS|nr:hypothetical protein OUZ56_016368 [Daphnia magna]
MSKIKTKEDKDVQYWTAKGGYKDELKPRHVATINSVVLGFNFVRITYTTSNKEEAQSLMPESKDGNNYFTLVQKVVLVNAKMSALVTIKIRVLEQFLLVINTC